MHFRSGLPRIVSAGVALPFDEVLQLMPSANELMVGDGLDLVFLLVINDNWWCGFRDISRDRVIWDRFKEGYMENWFIIDGSSTS